MSAFGGEADMRGHPLMTQSGHVDYAIQWPASVRPAPPEPSSPSIFATVFSIALRGWPTSHFLSFIGAAIDSL